MTSFVSLVIAGFGFSLLCNAIKWGWQAVEEITLC